MIHYNDPWTRAVENHAGLVVHGPLNLINLLNYWKDVHGEQGSGSPRQISYRALAPIYAGETYQISTRDVRESGNERLWEVAAAKDGARCMKAEILA